MNLLADNLIIEYLHIGIRLLLAAICGGLVGLERETRNRPAGLRTHMLVCVGSALIMMVSTHIYALFGSVNDPGRIAAQVVTGIGFLGAGTIIRQGNIVRGLTTAAGLWVVSGIGLAIGTGFYLGAFITVVLVLLILFLLRWVESKIFAKGEYEDIVVEVKDIPGQIGKIGTLMGNLGVNIRNVTIEDKGEDSVIIEFQVTLPSHISRNRLMTELSQLDEVMKVSRQTLGFI